MMKLYKMSYRCLAVLLVLIACLCAGCNGGDDDTDDGEIQSGIIKGTAYYPFYDENNQPVYYEGKNYDIFVTLHDRHGNPLETCKTDASGFYQFTNLSAGTYSVSAYLEEYRESYNLYDIFIADMPEFYLESGEMSDEDIFLEYSHSESGKNRLRSHRT